jgi:hypothetical protein
VIEDTVKGVRNDARVATTRAGILFAESDMFNGLASSELFLCFTKG